MSQPIPGPLRLRTAIFSAFGRRLAIALSAIAIYSILVCAIVRRTDYQMADWSNQAAIIQGVVLGLLQGFRNRSAYERWWEARKLWGQLTNDTRNLCAKLVAEVPRDVLAKSRIGSLIEAFPFALKQHLRGDQSPFGKVAVFLEGAPTPQNVPYFLSQKLFEIVAKWRRDGVITELTQIYLEPHLRAWMDVCGACERMRNTPLPPSHVNLLRFGLGLNVLVGPWYVAAEFGWFGIPVFLLVCLFILGVELIDSEIEMPFGTEPNQLDLDAFCATIENAVTSTLPCDAIS